MMKGAVWILAGLAVVSASCGGQASQETPATTGGPAATTSTTVAAEPDVVPVAVEPCDLVEIDEVTAAADLTVDEARNDSPISCTYDFGEEVGVAIFLNIDDGEGRFGAPASLFENYMAMVPDGSAEVISDLGAAAVYVQSFRGLAVDAGGGRFIGLGVNGGYGELAEPRDVLIELAAIALKRL
jgi:hypothetical protein